MIIQICMDTTRFIFQTVGRACWAIHNLGLQYVETKADLMTGIKAVWICRSNYRKFVFGNHRTFSAVRNGASVIHFR